MRWSIREAQVPKALEMSAAEQRARRLYRPGPFRGAYLAGAAAARAGRPVEACPYRGRDGWGSRWRRAWERGWWSEAPPDW